MIMRKRYLTVPKNKIGIEECDIGVDYSVNILTYELPEKEFNYLAINGFFNQINEVCETLIDDYESEVISTENLKICKDVLKGSRDEISVFYNALHQAIEYNTILVLDF